MVRLDKVKHVVVKQRLRDLLEQCRVKRRKHPGTIAKWVELADELVKQVGETGAKVANRAVSMTFLR